MKRYILAGFLTAIILFPLFGYTYMKGCQDGVARYRHSKRFVLTLESMYKMGYGDGFEEGKHKGWALGYDKATDVCEHWRTLWLEKKK